MKIVLLAATFFGYSFASCSQDISENQVPSLVKNSFKTQFTEATDIKWEKEKNVYEAEFVQNQQELSAQFDEAGKLLYVKTEIALTDIPAAVLQTITAKYADKKIDEAEKIVKEGKTFYEVELDGRFLSQELVLTEDGKIDKNQKF